MSSGALLVALSAAVLLAFGYLIKFQGWTFLVAGYDASTEIPAEYVGDVVGSTFLRLGIALLAYAAVVAVGAETRLFELLFWGVFVLAIARMLYRVNTYTPERS
jgi:hypothetical protein